MKQENKIKRIFQAFTEGDDISQELIDKRREICDTCPLNSKNSTTLTLIQRQRKAILGEDKPFCTACGCQIHEKTSRGSESCGLEEKGLDPKWNRVYLRTSDPADIDIENLSPLTVNISIDTLRSGFIAKVIEDVKIGEPLVFDLKFDREFSFNVFCHCLSKTEKTTNDTLRVHINTSGFGTGNLLKTVEVLYKDTSDKLKMNKITIKGKLTDGKL